jgi:alpha-1,3-rhamnosyl/mannosyltransferase
MNAPLRVAMLYDMDACHAPTGVTRHAIGQFERLAARPDVAIHLVSGRITQPDGLAYWQSLRDRNRHQLPLRTRDLLRWWRLRPWPPIEWWTGPVDWIYCPAELFVPAHAAGRAVTSHDVFQTLEFESPRKKLQMARVFARADLIFSVSQFNSDRLCEAFPACRDRVVYVPNAADDLFFEAASAQERAAVRQDLGLPEGMPYLLSVANFQPRKNLVRLVHAAARLAEVERGEMALVLIGTGAQEETGALRATVNEIRNGAVVRMPGYRQGTELRAAYAEATALVFPSLCESFGIPAVEAMAQGLPVALAASTALPEIGGAAGWYFDPRAEAAITGVLRDLLDHAQERARRAALGREIASRYRWQAANDRLVRALIAGPRAAS